MKILIIGYKLPFPGKDGGEYALKNFAAGLLANEKCEIHYMTISEKSISQRDLPPELQNLKSFLVVKFNTVATAWGIIKTFFSTQSYFISRFYKKEIEKEIILKLKEHAFDIIHLEHICLAPYIGTIRKNSAAKIIVRTQNIEYLRWQSIIKYINNPIKNIYFRIQTKKLERNEKYLLNLPDGIIALTNEDGEEISKHLKKQIPVKIIPLGYHFQEPINNSTVKKDEIIRFYFIGSMDWIPNLQGIDWFLKELYPEINKKIKNVEFHFAGKNTPRNYLKLNLSNVFFHGEVENANDFIYNYDMLFVPLRSGGGMKIKIMEALANGKPVLAHSSALNGFDPDQSFIYSFNSPNELVNCIAKIQSLSSQLVEIKQNSKHYAEHHFNTITLTDTTFHFYERLLLTTKE